MTEDKDIALVTDYLENQLAPEEREGVATRLEGDADFKALYEDIKTLQGGLERLSHKRLLSRLDQLEEGLGNPLEQKQETKTVYWTFQRLAAAFIGLAIVALASWYGLNQQGGIDGVALYEAYYEVRPNTEVPTFRGEGELNLLNRTFQAYDQGNYAEASALFEDLMSVDDRTFVKLYAGLAYMELGQADKASKLLEEVRDKDEGYAIPATWYLALNYLKTEEYDNTMKLLEWLVAEETTYATRAKELLKKIE